MAPSIVGERTFDNRPLENQMESGGRAAIIVDRCSEKRSFSANKAAEPRLVSANIILASENKAAEPQELAEAIIGKA